MYVHDYAYAALAAAVVAGLVTRDYGQAITMALAVPAALAGTQWALHHLTRPGVAA